MRHPLKLAIVALIVAFPGLAARAQDDGPVMRRAEAVALVRTTFVRLNDANRTANYQILHDLSAPAFRQRFTAKILDRLFADLRERKVDLTHALMKDPVINSAQYLSSEGIVRFKGQLRTGSVDTNFQLSFQFAENDWKLFGIALDFKRPPAPGGA